MPTNPGFLLNYTYKDRSGETARFGINVGAPIDMTTLPASVTAFNTALATVIDGLQTQITNTVPLKIANGTHSGAGQREEKWLLTYQDDTTLVLYQTELPCRKNSVQPPVNTDEVDITVAPWPAFATAFNALAKSPDGNNVTLIGVTLIGRSI